MAINDRTVMHMHRMRVQIDRTLTAEELEMVRAWGRAWTELTIEWDAALADLVASSRDGRWPSRRQISRAERVQRALDLTRVKLDKLLADFGARALRTVPTVTREAAAWQARVIASTMPEAAGHEAALELAFNRVDERAVEAIVNRTTKRIESQSRPLSAQAVAAMRSTLVRGVALGENPRAVAGEMVRRVQGHFDGGRHRALVIARTEMLDAHRAAAQAQDLANSDVVTGWRWIASLDPRSCSSCWSMHGRTFPVEQPGPHDHQQGRCARGPVTKTWAELGFEDIEEPEPLVADAEATFRGLSRAEQVGIVGARQLRLLNAGKISWADLAMKRETSGWRDSYAPTPLKVLQRRAAH